MKKPTKYVNVLIVQGNYGCGWEDLGAHDTWKEAREEKKTYNENECYSHRIISRRVLRTNYETGNF